VPDERDSTDVPPRARPRETFDSADEAKVRDTPSTLRTVPKLIRAAGIIWIVSCCLILLNAAVNIVIVVAFSGAVGGPHVIEGVSGSNAGTLFAVLFIFVGAQIGKGTPTDTLGIGIASIILGVLNAGVGILALLIGLNRLAFYVMLTPQEQVNDIAPSANAALVLCIGGGVSTLCGLGLILAGVLALMGRADYKTYRQARKRSAPIDD
jgi:hypothetical protein